MPRSPIVADATPESVAIPRLMKEAADRRAKGLTADESTPDISSLAQDPKFLAMSDQAKKIVLGQRDPKFAKLSLAAQDIVIKQRFPSAALKVMPAKDPHEDLHAKARGMSLADYGKAAADVAAPIIGGAVGAIAGGIADPLGGEWLGAKVGAGVATAGLSLLEGDPWKLAATKGGAMAAFPGMGETVGGTIVKFGVFGGVSDSLEQVAKTGKLGDKGHVAMAAVFSGLTGGAFRTAADTLPYLKEFLPEGVATRLSSWLGGKHADIPKEDIADVEGIRISSQPKTEKGKFGKPVAYDLSKEEVATLRSRGKENVFFPPGVKAVHPEYGMTHLNEETIFPPLDTPITEPRPLKGVTALTSSITRPRNLADHVQTQTGLPMYDQVYRPLQEAQGDYEKIKKVEKLFKINFENAPEPVKVIGQQLIDAAKGFHFNKDLIYGVRTVLGLADDEAARRVVNGLISSPYTSLLPYRPMTAVRVFAHTFQTNFLKAGMQYTRRGFAKAFSKEGIRDMVRAGAAAPADLLVPEEILGQGTGWYQKAVNLGFGMFRRAQDWSRAITFHAARERAIDAMRVSKNWSQFLDKSWMDVGIPQADVKVAEQLWRAGRKSELVDFVGKTHMESYIPGHSNLDRPMIGNNNVVGRMATQLTNWPSFYGQTLKENFLGPGPMRKKVLMAARFLAANTALFTAYKAYYGDDKKAAERAVAFTFLGPIIATVGPGLAQDIPNMAKGAAKVIGSPVIAAAVGGEEGFRQFKSGAKQFGKAVPLPFKGAIEDAYELIKKGMES